MKKAYIIFLFVSLILASCQSATQQPTVTMAPTLTPTTQAVRESSAVGNLPRVEPLEECFVKPPENLASELDMDCGYVVVPEFYHSESAREIKLGFTRFNSGKGASVSPFFKYVGGPGSANIEDPSYLLLQPDILGKILDSRDIVLVEQRGTLYTDTFLNCPGVTTIRWTAYEQGLTGEELDKLNNQVLEKCVNDFKNLGINLDAYNSLENAADVNAVREALGYDQIVYYGASYGSQLGQHVMRDFPEILEAVVLDGASALSRKSWVEDRALDAQWAIDNLTKLCEADAKCRDSYDIPALLAENLALFDNGPLPFTYTDPNDPSLSIKVEVTKLDFVNFVHEQQGTTITTIALPSVLKLFSQGGSEFVSQVLGTKKVEGLLASRDSKGGTFASLMHNAVVCSDDRVDSVSDVKTEGTGEYATLFAQSAATEYERICKLINVKELPDTTDVNVTSDIPTLLLTGGLDVETPAYHSQLVAESLSNATLIIFPGTTHVQLAGGNICAAQVMTQFIQNPGSELDLSCIDEMRSLPFTILENMEGETSTNANESVITGEFPQDLAAQLDAYLQSQLYSEGGMPKGAAPGLVLLVDTPQGRYLKAAGVSSLDDGTPMQVDDRLEIGSNSKSFTIVVLMQLQEEGVLSIDDLLSDWLPELAAKIPNGDVITLRQLAAHSSGIWDYGDPIIGEAANNPEKLEQGYTPDELVQYAIENGAPDFAPGEGWKYSNTGYILLGMITEKASGQLLGDLYQKRIFDPLGLKTAVFIEGVPQPGEITTQGYWWKEDDGTRLNTTNWNVSQGWAAGGIAMTAEDLLTYAKALAAGDLFQDPDSLAQMLTFNDEATMVGGAPFGLGLIDFSNGYWGHEGQTAGFQSLWYTNPDEQITVIGLTNSAAYQAFSFLNVRNILNGTGVQPFQAATLLPIADLDPAVVSSRWEWRQTIDSSGTANIDPGNVISLSKDGSAVVKGFGCGVAFGTFTTPAPNSITFDLDRSTVTCTGDEPLVALLNSLETIESWSFENGMWVLTLTDSSELRFFSAAP